VYIEIICLRRRLVNTLSEQSRSVKPRQYQMRKRAEQMDDTLRRIVEATTSLHATLGPARTTIAGIAERAGVTRLTVYRHFPDDETLYNACSAHWRSQQQLPDPAAWAELADPGQRLVAGLSDIYRFYRAGEPMLLRIQRDKRVLPESLQQNLRDRDTRFRDVLLEPFDAGTVSEELRGVVGHAVSFWTWHSLCRDNGLSDAAAVQMMAALARAASRRGA
jgi:AcrR family transcriptional regulator